MSLAAKVVLTLCGGNVETRRASRSPVYVVDSSSLEDVAAARYLRVSLKDQVQVSPSRVLGTGCSGAILAAVDRRSGTSCAVKTFSTRRLSGEELERLRTELRINLEVQHPNIVRGLNVYESGDSASLVMERCRGGELLGRVTRRGFFQEADARSAARQMALAVEHLHRSGIVHRDLKLENFLYESAAEGAALKLCDFGFSKIWDRKEKMTEMVGTEHYAAPEVLEADINGGYTERCDLWSLGVTVFALLSGKFPAPGAPCGPRAFAGRRWQQVSPEARDFVSKLLVLDPDKRMSAAECLQHPWLAQDSPQLVAETMGVECFAPTSPDVAKTLLGLGTLVVCCWSVLQRLKA